MNKGLWIARKNYLCAQIKKVSDIFEGDDICFVREHCKEIIDRYKDERIEGAIACYEEIIRINTKKSF